jgi:hypothetical protein
MIHFPIDDYSHQAVCLKSANSLMKDYVSWLHASVEFRSFILQKNIKTNVSMRMIHSPIDDYSHQAIRLKWSNSLMKDYISWLHESAEFRSFILRKTIKSNVSMRMIHFPIDDYSHQAIRLKWSNSLMKDYISWLHESVEFRSFLSYEKQLTRTSRCEWFIFL